MVTLLTVNAELDAMCHKVMESLWLINLLEEMDLPRDCEVLCDNEGALKTVKNPALLEETMHVRKSSFHPTISCTRHVQSILVNTKENIADILTKALARLDFNRLRLLGCMRD
mgnify:CR=1 FL=1